MHFGVIVEHFLNWNLIVCLSDFVSRCVVCRPALDSIEWRTSWQDLRILDARTKWRGSWHTRRSDLTLSCQMSHKSRVDPIRSELRKTPFSKSAPKRDPDPWSRAKQTQRTSARTTDVCQVSEGLAKQQEQGAKEKKRKQNRIAACVGGWRKKKHNTRALGTSVDALLRQTLTKVHLKK